MDDDVILDALIVGAQRQHEHAEQWGEVACTWRAPCIFCQAIMEHKAKQERRDWREWVKRIFKL